MLFVCVCVEFILAGAQTLGTRFKHVLKSGSKHWGNEFVIEYLCDGVGEHADDTTANEAAS